MFMMITSCVVHTFQVDSAAEELEAETKGGRR